MSTRGTLQPLYNGRPVKATGLMRHGQFPGSDSAGGHKSLELLEDKLDVQTSDIEKLARENRKLAAAHVTLRQELVAAEKEIQNARAHIRSIQTESDIQMRVLLDKIAKMEANIEAREGLKKDLQQAHKEAQALVKDKQELAFQIQQETQELHKRKRPGSSNEAMSDVSSVSERFYQPSILDSSPLQAPIFSDDVRRSVSRSVSTGSYIHNKRPRHDRTKYPASSNHARVKVRTATSAATSWKNNFHLPESSPVCHRRHARFGRQHVPSLSFVSETSTVPDPHSPLLSEDDDEDLPITSFSLNRSHFQPSFQSSPPKTPRTPPPDVARSARLRQRGFNAAGAAREGKHGDNDANLLMYLATSPTPVRPGHQKPQMLAPSTPPPKATPLPSSMMSTPGGGGSHYTGFGLATPSTNLNFAEFLNMSPSPAQVNASSWNRTPIATRTPAAVREARRHLNFDNIAPSGDASHMTGHMGKVDSFGMDLGGELIS